MKILKEEMSYYIEIHFLKKILMKLSCKMTILLMFIEYNNFDSSDNTLD